MWDKLKGGMSLLLGLGIMIGLLFLVVLFIEGGARLGVIVYPWLATAAGLALAIALFVLLPLSLLRSTRDFSAAGLLIASYVIGLALWVWALIVTYGIWGFWAVLIGLFIMGVGILPVAMLATLFNGMWPQLGELVLATVLVFGIRAYSFYVTHKAERDELYADN